MHFNEKKYSSKHSRNKDNNQKIANYNKGVLSEYLTSIFLILKGYKIINRRYRNKLGEIDLICLKGDNLVAVEVKSRSDKEDLEVLSNRQMQRICNSMKLYISSNKNFQNCNIRFDLVIYNSIFSIKHIKNAWQNYE